jgi:ABC-type multidrug transport system ATPase subunit
VNLHASRILSRVDLQQQADITTKLYCGGDRRKLALGISLIGNPAILLIDECCSGIDPLSTLKLWKSISDASKDAGVLFVTHNFQEAEALCMEIAVISSNRVHFKPQARVSQSKNRFNRSIHDVRTESKFSRGNPPIATR